MGKIIKNGLEYGDTSLPSGGKEDQVLAKKSSLDNDVEWKDTGLSTEDWPDILTPLPGQPTEGIIISPEERQVGWYYNMDGSGTKKPIYQKTVSDTMPTCTTQGTFVNKTVSLNASIDKFLGLKCILEGSGSGSTSWFNGLFYELLTAPSFRADGSLNACGMIYCQNNSANTPNTVVLQNGIPGYSGMTAYVTLRYTKTTDTYA